MRELRELVESKEEKYLTFTLAGEEYGIHISEVSEIIEMMPVTPVHGISDHIKGVINLRGRVIPVADLRLRLGFESTGYTDRTCIIVVEIEEETEKKMIGLIVDSVSEVLNIKGKDIETAPELAYADLSFISGMARPEGSVKILLDVKKLLEEIA
ncbi:chemotaxis protein CheW [Desulfobacterales bacterium HSG2]|nr:chemotaxis protein CheW [Desulfobacterales bacterium HSG2]